MAKAFKKWIAEDGEGGGAPANSAGGGGVAGIGIGPKGEPGVKLPRKKRKEDEVVRGPRSLIAGKVMEAYGFEPVTPNTAYEPNPELNPPKNPLQDHHDTVLDGLRTELGRTRYSLTQTPKSRKLKEQEASLLRKITRTQNKIEKSLTEESAFTVVKSTAKDATGLYCHGCQSMLPTNSMWDKSKTKGLHERGTGHKVDYVKPYDNIAEGVEPVGTFAGADVFEVDGKVTHASRFGKNRYHRYSRYVGEDEAGEAIRQHGRSTKKDIVLKDNTGVMVYLRRKAPK